MIKITTSSPHSHNRFIGEKKESPKDAINQQNEELWGISGHVIYLMIDFRIQY